MPTIVTNFGKGHSCASMSPMLHEALKKSNLDDGRYMEIFHISMLVTNT